MRPRRFSILPSAVLAVLLLAPLALASDGALEIHQACVASGCFPGDPPGFPVLITANGAYVLTSNLEVPDENTSAIRISAEFATLDLGGFVISGVTECSDSPPVCSPTGSGIGIDVDSGVPSVSVRDGRIIGMGSVGVNGLAAARVEKLDVQANGGTGIRARRARDNLVVENGGHGIEGDDLIVDNQVHRNHGIGIACGREAMVRGNRVNTNGTVTGGPGISCLLGGLVLDNVVTDNEGPGLMSSGGALPVAYGNNVFQSNNDPATPANQVTGAAVQIGPNICEGVPCP